MLKERILSTVRFFDVQDWPLTLLELVSFLLPSLPTGRQAAGLALEDWPDTPSGEPATLGAVLSCLSQECSGELSEVQGFWCLKGREELVSRRLGNYAYGIGREQRIIRYAWVLRHLPFVRAVALGGSQALGQQTEASDIDLFVVTDPDFLWVARTLVTAYFQVFGIRRHGSAVRDRFCLNHYVGGPRELARERDLYNAMEYLRLRPLTHPEVIREFQQQNWPWISRYFPQGQPWPAQRERASVVQRCFELLLRNAFGRWVNGLLMRWQLARIKKGEFVVAEPAEISFHSKERKAKILGAFFKRQQQEEWKPVQPVVQVEP